jgi:two-component system chemotaxis sensor kinase CheA
MATETLEHTFITETEDLLAQMEDGLLQLETRPDDKEVLNAIFRSGHTVKGSAGILGQKEIVAFTHVLENVLDRLRKAELRSDARLTSLLLEGKDVLGEALGQVAAGERVTESAFYLATMAALRGYADLTTAAPSVQAAAPTALLEAPRAYRLELKLTPETFEQGQDPFMLLLELGDLAQVLRVEAHADEVPAFEALDVYKCHFSWTVVLTSACALERLLDVFLFVREEGRVELRPVLDCNHWT